MDIVKDRKISNMLDGVVYDSAKKIGHCRVLYVTEGFETVRYQDTDIAIKSLNNGHVMLYSGGFRTKTTRANINRAMDMWGIPAYITQDKSVWYVNVDGDLHVFYDGMEFDEFGKVLDPKDKAILGEVKYYQKLIKEYMKELKKVHLEQGRYPEPNAGDCWLCRGGAEYDFAEHVLSHLEEKYIHGSLIVRALLNNGYQEEQLPFVFQVQHAVEGSVRKYLKKSVGILA